MDCGLYACFMRFTRHFVMGVFVTLFLILLQTSTTFADRVAVHYREATTHGFLSVKSLEWKRDWER